VLLPNQEHREGALQHYNLHYNVALVSVKDFSAPHPLNIQPQMSNYSSVYSIGCCINSGMLMAARGQHTEMLGTFDCKLLKCSTCKITKVKLLAPRPLVLLFTLVY
jgi:hypothetical protein